MEWFGLDAADVVRESTYRGDRSDELPGTSFLVEQAVAGSRIITDTSIVRPDGAHRNVEIRCIAPALHLTGEIDSITS